MGEIEKSEMVIFCSVICNSLIAVMLLGGVSPEDGVFVFVVSLLFTIALVAGSIFTGLWVWYHR